MKVKKAAKKAVESAIWGVAEHLRLENGAWANHDEWIREAAIQVGDALVAMVHAGPRHAPIPPGAWWDGDALVLSDGGRVTVDADGVVIHRHHGRTDVFDREELWAAKAVSTRRPWTPPPG